MNQTARLPGKGNLPRESCGALPGRGVGLRGRRWELRMNFLSPETPNAGVRHREITTMRWAWLTICALLSLTLFVGGWLVPAHLRAVDANLLKRAGRGLPTLAQAGLGLVEARQVGAAEMLLEAAVAQEISDRQPLALAVASFARQQPAARWWGVPPPRWATQTGIGPDPQHPGTEPFTEVVVQSRAREAVLQLLESSPRSPVPELLRLRTLTNTVLIPPSPSASGQAFDAAVAITGLLLEGGHLTPQLQTALTGHIMEALRGGESARIEQAMLDLLSLGQRFNWGQLLTFVERIDDVETLRLLAHHARQAGEEVPQLFTAVVLSGSPGGVTRYLTNFNQTGMADLSASLRHGVGGVNELLARQHRIGAPGPRQTLASYDPFGAFYYFILDYCWLMPRVALGLKWLLYLAAGYFLLVAVRLARAEPPADDSPLSAPGLRAARDLFFASGFLLVVLLLSEPFLAQESQKGTPPFQPRLPLVSGVTPTAIARALTPVMNQFSLMALLFFFLVQSLIYTACLIKLAEIRRQLVSSRVRLKLLENEEHLFDAGLYVGFVGTIVSLIFVSLGVIKPSLMAAYSSTAFGIIFVAAFKIFHLRPLRRRLLIEMEEESMEIFEPAPAPAPPPSPPPTPVKRKRARHPAPREGEQPDNPFRSTDALPS